MKTLTARERKDSADLLTDSTRAELVAVVKHRRPLVVVMAVEEFERLKAKAKSAGWPRLLSKEG